MSNFVNNLIKWFRRRECQSCEKEMKQRGLSKCPVCGGCEFVFSAVLWPELVKEWNLSKQEEMAINMQQGYHCRCCNSNLRSMTLAAVILDRFGWQGTFEDFCRESEGFRRLSVLEINAAGSLSRFLSNLPRRELARYPAANMERMPYPDGTWDVILHSDTLEHVGKPVDALAECKRILKNGGLMAWTVPLLVGRKTVRRGFLCPSYHGAPGMRARDYKVVTEYGADAWCEVMEAGFRDVAIFSLIYPFCMALVARKM